MKLQPKTLTTLILTLLIIASTFAFIMPNATAAEITTQQKGLTTLSDVINIDTAKYTINTKQYPQESYFGVLPKETIRYDLYTNGSKLEALYTFVNGKLLMVDVLENHGSPRLTKTVNGVSEMAKDFLNNYQAYSKNPLYGELRSMLVDIDPNKNLTKTIGNTKFEVNTLQGNFTDRCVFRWTYTFNGIEAPDKVVALGYKNGFLNYFFDSWDLYKIGSTEVNISEEYAINIGMARARNYSWPIGTNGTLRIQNFNVTNAMVWETVFRSSLVADIARNDNLLVLYPMRHVWVSLDKFYPGNVYGFNVYVWADTGEVANIQERISTQDPPSELYATADDFTLAPLTTIDSELENNLSTGMNDKSLFVEASSTFSSNMIIGFSAIALLILGGVMIYSRKKNVTLRHLSKISGLLLCLLAFSTLLTAISIVSAVNPQERATIWTSRSIGAYNHSLGFSWRKHPTEVVRQEETAASIASSFNSNGYDTSNYHGSIYNGIKERILAQISRSEALYPRTAVVVFDHGNGNDGLDGLPSNEFHYMFEDDNGTRVGGVKDTAAEVKGNGAYDYEIYPRTDLGKVFFAFINTCNSANIDDYLGNHYSKQGIVPLTERARGMPFAFTHLRPNIDMSGQGYWSNSGDFVYIGFHMGSAALQQSVEGSSYDYYIWVQHFFGFALTYDMSVSNALDQASGVLWPGKDWWETPLYQGFESEWPMHNGTHWNHTSDIGWMRVYGNGNMHLYQKGGAWDFNENNGSTAYDSRLNNDGTIYGATWTTGKVGSALSFDGQNDYVQMQDHSSLNVGSITISFWVKQLSRNPNDWTYLLSKAGYGSYHVISEDKWGSNQIGFTVRVDGNDYRLWTSKAIGNYWTHLTFTYNAQTGVQRTYVNGFLDTEQTNTPGSIDTVAGPLRITGAKNYYFNGVIDEVRVYNYAMSPKQIADDAAVASYHLNGGDSDYHYAFDSSPYGNTATIYGASWTYGVRTSGVHSLALSFDGIDDYVSVSSVTGLSAANSPHSILAWVKVNSLPPNRAWILQLGNEGLGSHHWLINNQGGTQFGAWGGGQTQPALPVGQWTHIAITFDGSTLRSYVDGVASQSVAATFNIAGTPLTLAQAHIGENYFNGVIDEVYIYDRALSADEIAAYYSSNFPRHWLSVWAWNDEYSYSLYPWIKIDGQYTSLADVTRGTHMVEVQDWVEDPYLGWFYFDRFTYGSTTDYNNPMTISVSKDTEVIAHYYWYGW